MPNLATLKQLPAKSKAAIAVSAVAILAITFLLLRIAGAPTYAVLSAGLEPAETGKVTAVLDEQAIPYELRANGTTVAVDKASLAKARVAVSGAGVATTTGAGEGFELFDEQKLGASDFQQKVTYQRALEGEIARTIGGMQGVSGAQVQLVLPEDELFADEASPATAAVMLDNSADTLESGSIRGMAQLVAASVKGLKTENVTITDGAGQLLWPQGDGVSTAGTGAAGKQAMEARYERQLEADLGALLARTLGAGKAQVQVKSDLNVDKTTLDELKYERRGVPLETTEETEELEGSGARAGGRSATAGNVPTYSAGTAGGGDSSYNRESRTQKMGVGKLVTRTEVAPGKVNRLQVALMVDKTVDPKAFAEVQRVVASAAGIDTGRGDELQAAQVAFAAPPAPPKAGPVPVAVLDKAKVVALGLAMLLFLFFMARHLRRREGETLAEPAWLTHIERPTPLSELEAGRPTREMPLPEREPDFQLQTLDQLTEREPERVAAQVKAWMAED
jgi:flagellar M-ring protein FliF